MFSFFKREKWTHLSTSEETGIYWAKGTFQEKKNGTIYIHFYESNKGNRKIESICSISEAHQDHVDEYVKSSNTYQTRYVRWLAGRNDPEIPKYSDTPEEDTANALRGKVE